MTTSQSPRARSATSTLGAVDDDAGRIPPDVGAGPLLPLSHSPPSPLAGRAIRSAGGEDGAVAALSPPLLRRRAFSHDHEARRGQRRADGIASDRAEGEGGATVGIGVGRAAATARGAIGNGAVALRTIPSRDEMDKNDEGGSGSAAEGGPGRGDGGAESIGRRALFSTPTRGRPFRPLQSHNIPNRSRAASSDVVLDISSDCLPRYDSDLAFMIDAIADDDVGEEEENARAVQGGRGGAAWAFSTPERPIARPSSSRERANTCPHRPQRHSIFQQQRGMDEEFGMQQPDDHPDPSEEEGGDYPREVSSENRLHTGFTPSSAPARTHRPTDEPTNDTNLHHSPDRRSHSSTSTLQSPPRLATPVRRTSSSSRPPLPSSLSSPNTAPPNPAAMPRSPQTTNNRPSALPSSSVRRVVSSAARQRPDNFIYRMNPAIMKFLMVISLYTMLAYTWNTDLQPQSVEINFGLSEYWHGGLGMPGVGKPDKMARNVPGKLFNDDGDDQSIANLINGLGGGDDSTDGPASGSGSASGDSPSSDVGEDAVASSLLRSGITPADKGKRRPSLSHARPSPTSDAAAQKAYAYGVFNRQHAAILRRQRLRQEKEWTLSHAAWWVVWAAFALPLVEAALREVRWQLNVRLWNVRRLRSFRAAPSTRATNVHDL